MNNIGDENHKCIARSAKQGDGFYHGAIFLCYKHLEVGAGMRILGFSSVHHQIHCLLTGLTIVTWSHNTQNQSCDSEVKRK